jgi:hypothetical protein
MLESGLIHGAETEYLQAKLAQADKDIREQFDRILGMIGRADESKPVERPIVHKPH